MKIKFNPDGSLINKDEILKEFEKVSQTKDEDLSEEDLLIRNFAKSIANIWKPK